MELNSFLEILQECKYSVSDVINEVGLDYWSEGREYKSIYFNLTDLENNSMILPTRSIYPSDKMTFTLPDLNRDKTIVFLNIYLDMYEQFDVGLVLEDSKRKELSESQEFFLKIVNWIISCLRVKF